MAKKNKPNARATFDKACATLMGATEDMEKFDGGNKSAGSRIRKAAQETKVLLQQLRKEVQEIKNAG